MTTDLPPFIRGWRSLPDELKLVILAHVLPAGVKINYRDFEVRTRSTQERDNFGIHVLPYLACREISGLAVEGGEIIGGDLWWVKGGASVMN